MKYTDGPTVEVEARIEAPLETVWRLISNIEVPVQFSGEVQQVEWDDPGAAVAVGSRFAGHNRHDRAGEWSVSCVVTHHDAPHTFGWAVGDPAAAAASWQFRAQPSGNGVTLRQSARLGPGPSGLSTVIEAMPDREDEIIERRLAEHRTNMQATVDGIKGLAESAS